MSLSFDDMFSKKLKSGNAETRMEDQIQFYDSYWEELKPFSAYKVTRIIKILELLLSCRIALSKSSMDICDLGCGDGRSVAIWNIFGNSTGLDLSVKAMERARKYFPALEFYSGNALSSPFQDESFDVVISQEVIEHIEYKEQERYLEECWRILRPGGFLILTTPNKFYFDKRRGGNYSNQPIENLVTPSELRGLLKTKFHVIRHETIIPATGDYGIYRLIDNRFLIKIFRVLGLDFFRGKIKNYFHLSLNQVVWAKKIESRHP